MQKNIIEKKEKKKSEKKQKIKSSTYVYINNG